MRWALVGFYNCQPAFVTRYFVSGKTVQMIATMAVNMPKETDAVKATLIVVPSALLQQVSVFPHLTLPALTLYKWKEEINTKSNDLFTVHIHHGRDKLATLTDIRSKDVRHLNC